VTSVPRIVVAFLLSPLAAAAAVTVVVSLGRGVPLPGFVIATTIVAYGAAFVLGIPTFLMTRPWLRRSLYAYATVGFVIGLIPAALVWPFASDIALSVAVVFGSGVAASIFWFIAVRESNNALERERGR
jgi:hypothetical protein